jgi:hypothetical protein
MPQQFEYKIITDDAWKVQTTINALGAQGWEAVSTSATPAAVVCLLRRVKASSDEK